MRSCCEAIPRMPPCLSWEAVMRVFSSPSGFSFLDLVTQLQTLNPLAVIWNCLLSSEGFVVRVALFSLSSLGIGLCGVWNKDHEELAPLTLAEHDFLSLSRAHCIFTHGTIQAVALPLPRRVHDRRPRSRLWGVELQVKAFRLSSMVSVNILNRW